MKKLISYLLFYVVFCLIQFFLGRYVNVYGIFPNFILILIVYLGLSKGIMNAQLTGFLFGLTWDVFSTDIFGIRAVMFAVIGYFAGRFCGSFDREKTLTQFVIVFFASIVYWAGFSLIYFVVSGGENYAFSLTILSILVKIIITVLFAPLVFYILDRIVG